MGAEIAGCEEFPVLHSPSHAHHKQGQKYADGVHSMKSNNQIVPTADQCHEIDKGGEC
jgi:hypothetical protein